MGLLETAKENDNLMTTYKMADGTLIYGEFSFVTGPEFFDDVDQPTDVLKESWVRVAYETVTFGADEVEEE